MANVLKMSSSSVGCACAKGSCVKGKLTTREPPWRLADRAKGVSFIHETRAKLSGCVTLPSSSSEENQRRKLFHILAQKHKIRYLDDLKNFKSPLILKFSPFFAYFVRWSGLQALVPQKLYSFLIKYEPGKSWTRSTPLALSFPASDVQSPTTALSAPSGLSKGST